jgi:hypothetical protein
MELRRSTDLTRCHNAQHGTFGHECGRPATWTAQKVAAAIPGLGINEPYIFESSFCDDCREFGHEAQAYKG